MANASPSFLVLLPENHFNILMMFYCVDKPENMSLIGSIVANNDFVRVEGQCLKRMQHQLD